MTKIKVDFAFAGVTKEEMMSYQERVLKIYEECLEKKNDEKEMLGWIELPSRYDKEEFRRIKECASRIQEDSSVLVVIGIGGSYLGARAVIEALTNTFYNYKKRECPQILYAGNNVSERYLLDMIELIGDRDFSVNVISKSGTTLEPGIAFRVFKGLLEEKYGDEARKRIYVTTDKCRGALKEIASNKGYETFIVPDDLGGRYSVFSAVGLLPIAVVGIDIERLLEGARVGQERYFTGNLEENSCYLYAVWRNILYGRGKKIEILANYEPKLFYVAEWWKQLFGESEGKELKGIFPVAMGFTTDLHSMGQYIQEGERILFETVIEIEKSDKTLVVEEIKDNLDGLNYLAGKSLTEIGKKIREGVVEAHSDGGVFNVVITLDDLTEEAIGELLYFFELACWMSAKILGVNPFNQPGVDVYKKKMFKLLGK